MGVTTLIDVLKHVPGIETSMGVNGNYRISIRGMRYDGNVLVLIDGHSINDFYDGRPIFDFPMDFIEKIEVIRGPGSALFGSNALAGVINIITKKNEKSAAISGGTNTTFSGNANYFYKGKINFNISTGYSQTNGANVFPRSDDPAAVDKNDKKTNYWLKDAYLQTNISYKKLRFSTFNLYRNQGSWVGPLYKVTTDCDFKNLQSFSDLSYNMKITPKFSIIPKIYSSIIQHDYLLQEYPDNYVVNGEKFIDGALTQETYTGINLGGEIQIDYFPNDILDITTGYVFENLSLPKYEVLKNYDLVGPKYIGEMGNYNNIEYNQRGKNRTVMAYYLQGVFNFKKVGVTMGFRYDDYSDFGQSLNPRLGIVYRISNIKTHWWQPFENIYIKLLYGQAFRAPTFKELYDKTNLNEYIAGVRGNESLDAGTVRSAEFGIEFSQRKYILRMNAFYNFANNIISIYDANGTGGVGVYENMGNTTSFGGEMEFTMQIIYKKLNFFINASTFQTTFEWKENALFNSHIRYMQKEEGDNELKNIPTFRYNAGFELKLFYKLQIFASTNFGSETESNNRFFMENRIVKIDSYQHFNFSVAFTPTKTWTFTVAANNLGAMKYTDPEESTNIRLMGKLGMGQPTETFLLKISYQFLNE